MGSFSGRKILVTGASSGIGRNVSVLLASLGARLVLNGRDEGRLRITFNSLPGSGHKMVAADLTDEKELEMVMKQSLSDGTKLTGLVHSAGIMPVLPLRVLDRDEIRRCMDINFYTFLELVRLYSEFGYGEKGSIVGISSIAAVQPEMGQISYSASKAAMNASVCSLAQELGEKGVRINTIMPGVTGDPASVNTGSEAIISRQVLGLARFCDVASICAYLLGSESKTITGRALYADGGRFL